MRADLRVERRANWIGLFGARRSGDEAQDREADGETMTRRGRDHAHDVPHFGARSTGSDPARRGKKKGTEPFPQAGSGSVPLEFAAVAYCWPAVVGRACVCGTANAMYSAV